MPDRAPESLLPTNSPNAALAAEYLDWQRSARDRAGSTLYDYGRAIACYLDHIEATPLDRVDVETMEEWLNRPRGGRAHGQRGSAATRAKEVTILRSMYAYLLARGLIREDPTKLLVAPKVSNRRPRPIPDGDWQKLWRADLLDAERLILGMGFFTGLRRREMSELGPHHVVTSMRSLMGFTRKGGGDDVMPYGLVLDVYADKMPHLPGAEEYEKLLMSFVEERAGQPYLLALGEGGPIYQQRHALPEGMTDPQYVTRLVKRASGRAGVESFGPHQLRHSFCTNLLRAGVPIHMVSELANHSSIDVTRRYAKAGGAELREWMDQHINRRQ